MTEQTQTETNPLVDWSLKAGEAMALYAEETHAAIIASTGDAEHVARIAVERMSGTLNQLSSLARSYAQQADLYGMQGGAAMQEALDKKALELAHVSDWLSQKLATGGDELIELGEQLTNSTIGKHVADAGGWAADAAQVWYNVFNESYEDASANLAGIVGGLLAAGAASLAGAPAWLVAAVGFGSSVAAEELFKFLGVHDWLVGNATDFLEWLDPNSIPQQVAELFFDAQSWTPPVYSDPLILDLDGDGIETTAQTGWDGVLFDHDNDGIKTATGWLSGDDGFLVMDSNNNGLIDNGGELFGDNTQLSNGTTASDGYAALADIDSNQDGVIDATDASFANLQVWQDINQDGISQASELHTLEQLGIASISTTGVVSGQTQNGNR